MCIMCHHCGEGLNNSKEERKIQVNVNLLKPGKKDCIWSCKHCGFKSDQELKHSESPYRTPMISSTTALSSSDRSESNCSKCPSAFLSSICFYWFGSNAFCWYNLMLLFYVIIFQVRCLLL